MANCSMPPPTDDLVGVLARHIIGELEPYFSIQSLDMYTFQSVGLPSDENLVEAIASFSL